MADTAMVVTALPNQSAWELTFPYLDPSDIKVLKNGVPFTAFSLDGSTITIADFIYGGEVFTFSRSTDTDNPAVEWRDATFLNPKDLDLTLLQNVYAIQEIKELLGSADGTADLSLQVAANTQAIATLGDWSVPVTAIQADIQSLQDEQGTQDQTATDINALATQNRQRIDVLEANGGGTGSGSSTLAGLTDTTVGTLSQGQILSYNVGTGTWINTTAADSSQVTTNTADIAELQTNVSGMIVEEYLTTCTFSILPDDPSTTTIQASDFGTSGFAQLKTSHMSGRTDRDNVTDTDGTPYGSGDVTGWYPQANTGGVYDDCVITVNRAGTYLLSSDLIFGDLPTANSYVGFQVFQNDLQQITGIYLGNWHPSEIVGAVNEADLFKLYGKGFGPFHTEPPIIVSLNQGDTLNCYLTSLDPDGTVSLPLLGNGSQVTAAYDASLCLSLTLQRIGEGIVENTVEAP